MNKLTLIAGPCVVESLTLTNKIAKKLIEITKELDIDFVFKASYKKANRSSITSFTGIGDIEALKILGRINESLNIPVITDVHETKEVALASAFVSHLQIPAFLCRQTELIISAANQTKVLNIKKGQWMNPDAMKYAVEKARSQMSSIGEVWVTERGTSFGYNSNVVDFTGIPIMKKFADKVIVDCTHSIQIPNSGETTGGNPEMIETIAFAATAAGADGLFFEVHPNPSESLSDASSILHIDKLYGILTKCLRIKKALE